MTRIVVFDLQGKLVNSPREVVTSIRACFAVTDGEASDDATILSIVGMSLPQAGERLSTGINADEHSRSAGHGPALDDIARDAR